MTAATGGGGPEIVKMPMATCEDCGMRAANGPIVNDGHCVNRGMCEKRQRTNAGARDATPKKK
jgi:hypothetical protein